ncbi:spermidine synthase [Streptomyces sp. DSM 44915]|uniref:Spermidine synthase n=1 Tax=Streptomyces chisholmiae TaxID=3075540 RepID=A0ABU2JKY9_9ACTN|nr:spermidine synthase [Streptomyces sp. DSM 44915]MDT0265653.1 spermidine synthase [Streptomyces sp. DSM 44915]
MAPSALPAPGTAGPSAGQDAADGRPVVLDRRTGPFGEVVLRRHGALLQIIANGCFLMDTSDGRSERLLVRAALTELTSGSGAARPHPPRLLIGGLGVGFSLAEAAAEPRWGGIDVVEREPAVLDWHRAGPLAAHSGGALTDPRVRVVQADLLAHLHSVRGRYEALCLDIDNGPDWTVTEDNDGLYSPAGLAACRAALTEGGVLVVWSAQPSATFPDLLGDAGFVGVRTEEVSVARGVPDVLFLASRHSATRSA